MNLALTERILFRLRHRLPLCRGALCALGCGLVGCGVVDAPSPVPVTLVVNEIRVAPARDGESEHDTTNWVEVYNAGTEPVALSGYHLSDRRDRYARYTFEDTILPPGGFYVVLGGEGPAARYCGFSFSTDPARAEVVALYDREANLVDMVDYMELIERLGGRRGTYGRSIDGGKRWVRQRFPTPGGPNSGS